MPIRWDPKEHLRLASFVLRWVALAATMATLTGAACAIFLCALQWATQTRAANFWLLYLLPVAGIAISLIYAAIGKSSERGNNLLIDEIHAPGGGLPRRMAPLILASTVLTHLFGGSAGREGTAVQMGGSIASGWARLLRLSPDDTRLLLMAGIAAGFGGVFGTPLAGTIFALEVLVIGHLRYEAIIPCLIAAIVGDQVSTHLGHSIGVSHTDYHQLVTTTSVQWLLLLKVALAALLFGTASVLFSESVHAVQWLLQKTIKPSYLRPAAGGLLVVALTLALGTTDYLGLGVTAPPGHASIVNSFLPNSTPPYAWALKILFTALTIGAGFKGGEVTPLFFIGAALGNTLAWLLGAPPELFAALGFVAVFAAATNTPLACTLMGLELFGIGRTDPTSSASPGMVVYLATACFLAYFISGHTGIYTSQRLHPTSAATLKSARESRRSLFRRR